MNDDLHSPAGAADSTLAKAVGPKARRKLRALGRDDAAWFGLGMMGLVGWSVALPTLLGAGLGLWLQSRHPGGRSWTLMLLVGGLCIGCFNAWHWMGVQDREMKEDRGESDH